MGRKHLLKNGYSSGFRDYGVENRDLRIQGKGNWAPSPLRNLLNSAGTSASVPGNVPFPLKFPEEDQGLMDSGFSSQSLFL